MDSRLYWIWLAQALGPGNRAMGALLARYTTAAAIYRAAPADLEECGLSAPIIKKLKDHSLDEAQMILDRTLTMGDWVLTPEDALYPTGMRRLEDMPAALYCRGTLPSMDDCPAIAVVGTRRATDEGIREAMALSAALAAGGMVIVSGGATGIDAAAHEGALYAEGKTVLVMGCPLTANYPVENEELRHRIVSSGGALVSEYPPDQPYKCVYQVRNRLMVGFSRGVCMAQTPTRSGARISARLARENGADVFAMPGALAGHHNDGAHREIRSGATLVMRAAEIIEEYLPLYPDRLDGQAAEEMQRSIEARDTLPRPQKAPPAAAPRQTEAVTVHPSASLPDTVSSDAKHVYTVLTDTPQPVDELADKCALPIPALLVALTELEICGCAANSAGQQYYRL